MGFTAKKGRKKTTISCLIVELVSVFSFCLLFDLEMLIIWGKQPIRRV